MDIVSTNKNVFILRFDKGEEFIAQIKSFCRSKQINGAFFYGLGGATSATLSRYVLEEGEYKPKNYKGDMEISSVIGNVAKAGENIVVHAHATVGLEDLTAVAGHVEELIMAGTCELHLEVLPDGLQRIPDSKTGLDLLASED